MIKDSVSLDKLLECSKREFLASGFKNASLRNIAAAAGLTTGAIYGYFKNKDAIFCALVESVCRRTEQMFTELSANYYTQDGAAYELNIQKSLEDIRIVYRFIYDNLDEWRLLLCCAEGSSRADYVHTIVEYEVEHSRAYIEKFKKAKGADFCVDDTMLHILCDSYINSLLEPVRHNMSYEDAIKNVEFLCMFFTGGWETVINSLFNSS